MTQMLIIQNSVVIITCIVVVLWLLVSYYRTQQALFWWNSRQWIKMCQQGEVIRNGLLQESFIIRRHLELSSINCPESQQQEEQYYLATIEKFHYSLKELSDYLCVGHIDDSLPLAIKSLLTGWKSRIPALHLELELPTEWHHESHFISRVILVVLEELLQMTLSDISSSVFIFISLKPREHFSELMVQIIGLDVSKLTFKSRSTQSDHLRRAFQFLTFGECFHHRNKDTEIWYFRWRYS